MGLGLSLALSLFDIIKFVRYSVTRDLNSSVFALYKHFIIKCIFA